MKNEPSDMLEADQMDQLLGRLEQRTLQDDDFAQLIKMARGLQALQGLYHRSRKATTKLLKMLFGAPTERTRTVTKQSEKPDPAGGGADPQGSSSQKKKRTGHGRRGSDQYPGAALQVVTCPDLKSGMECPQGCGGHLHDTRRPAINLHFKAQPLIDAIRFEQQRLRCGDCGAIVTAPLPAEYASKYDESVGVALGVARYGYGLPMNRLAAMQEMHGIPMPLGTQYEQIEDCYKEAGPPVLAEFMRQAAQGTVMHNDDTPGKVLDLKREINDRAKELSRDAKQRTGIFTTGIVSTREGRTIVLYATGNKHAGENLRDLLMNRPQDMQAPIQMCDALSRNNPGFETDLANCNAHARREFVPLAETHRAECAFVLETYRKVYINDAHARKAGLSPEERLLYHQQHSLKPMNAMREWMEKLMENKQVEPNSDLGGAIKYVIKHWDRLTLFLRKADAPVDNNVCERILKTAIRHRNNSLFYKTANGAKVGDFFMSVIQTCRLCGANPIHYLTTLRRRTCELMADPEKWMPWNYQANLTAPV